MTPLAQAISNLPENELVAMAFSRFARQIAEVITSKDSVKKKKAQVEKIRNCEIAQCMPDKEKQEMEKLCDDTIMAIDVMKKFK